MISMKTRFLSCLLCVFLLTGLFLSALPVLAAELPYVDIIELTDNHDKLGSSTDALAGRMAALVESVRQNRKSSTLLVGGGDFFTGSSTDISTRNEGLPMLEWLDYLDMDVMVAGNHEFDDTVTRSVIDPSGMLINCNLLKEDGSRYFTNGSALIVKNGIRILVVGSICELPYGLPYTLSDAVTAADPVFYTKLEIDKYSPADYDLILPVCHGDCAPLTSLAKLADEGYPVACVLGGHSHDTVAKDYYTPGGHHVPYFVSCPYNEGLATVRVYFDKATGEVSTDAVSLETNILHVGTENPGANDPYYAQFSGAWQIVKDWESGLRSVPHTAAAATPAPVPRQMQTVSSKAFGSCGKALSWTLDSNTGVLTLSGSGAMEDYGAGKIAPWHSARVTEVILPDGLTKIGCSAFAGNTALQSVRLPDSVEEIAPWAFCGCTDLTDADLPDGLTSIGRYAFAGCTALTAVTVPDGATSVGEGAFRYSGLTALDLPDSVLEIGGGIVLDTPLFYTQNTASGLYIDNHLICGSSANGTVESGTVSIADRAFYEKTALTDISLPTSLKHIGEWAFYDCSKLTDVTIPDSVETLGDFAFAFCSGLTKVNLGSGLKKSGFDAFYLCYNLTGPTAFNINNLKSWCETDFCNEFSTPTKYARSLSLNGTPVTEMTVPEGTNRIGQYAFYLCENLTSASLPASVSEIGKFAFYNCTNLKKVNIPQGVKWIAESTFHFCYSLNGAALPSSVTAVEKNAFYNCSRLRFITFEGNPPVIDGTAFEKAAPNTAACVYYPVTQAWKSFSKGSYGGNLLWLPLEGNLTDKLTYSIRPSNAQIFLSGADSMPSITGFDPWVFQALQGFIRTVTFDQNVKSVSSWSFANFSELQSVVLPAGIGSVGADAFRECTKLQAVYVLNSKCNIYASSAQTLGVPGYTVIYGYSGSTAQTWAKNNGYTFKVIGDCAANGHVFTFTKTVQPTCTSGGYALYTCALCGKTEQREVTAPCGHNFVSGVCTRCGAADPAVGDPCEKFTDVNRTSWYHSAADFVLERGLMGSTKTGSYLFEPNTPCTRAMIVTILYSLEGKPQVEYEPKFPDVKEGQWYTAPVLWAYQNGVVNGYDTGLFGTNDQITREQMAVILKAYADKCGKDTTAAKDLSGFPDAGKATWSRAFLSWAVAEGLLSGKSVGGQTLLDPQGKASRAEVAVILMRFIQNIIEA